MGFQPSYPIQDITRIVSGTITIIACSFVVIKLHKSSKNNFAYILIFCGILLGISNLGVALNDMF